jgi:protein-L-isoaspartate(D-aspartate) O-methyltransferase
MALLMDHASARFRMVENQLRTNQVVDTHLLAAMARLPREAFVPEALAGVAYTDEDLAIGHGRYLLEPLVLARLVQAIKVGRGDRVLDVACGVGYGAAVLADMAAEVVAVESDPALAARAEEVLGDLGLATVSVISGPLPEGHADRAPYDVIVVEGGVSSVPQTLLDQLAEGGRLAAVILPSAGMGKGTVFLRTHGSLSSRVAFDAATPPLPGFAPEKRFAF